MLESGQLIRRGQGHPTADSRHPGLRTHRYTCLPGHVATAMS
ncbi:hypothetical protein AB0O91_26855 [Kitasatospora sp. NPDC089797]